VNKNILIVEDHFETREFAELEGQLTYQALLPACGQEDITAIKENIQESRKDWMLTIFKEQGTSNSRNRNYQFWRQDNQPKELYAPEFTVQKLNYIHNNPVEAGLVEKPEDYLYSSARNYKYGNSSGLLPVVFL
jgi:hypothetical protein